MLDSFPLLQKISFPKISRKALDTLQVNLGYKCNLQCLHCHVNASPARTEVMDKENLSTLIDFVKKFKISYVDLTGGAPEMHPQFAELLQQLSSLKCQIIVRTNLVILNDPEYTHLIDLLIKYKVILMASMPCYLEENVDKQRGSGTFLDSIEILKLLNEKGYGKEASDLKLNLIYNPQGPELPPEQHLLERDYKKHLFEQYQIEFNNLLTITNLPIKRFGSLLMSKQLFDPYIDLLKKSFVNDNLESVMCRNIISVDWQRS